MGRDFKLTSTSESFHLENALKKIAHWLPSQGPIKDFIHHNTLHAFQSGSFGKAVSRASQLFGARCYLPLSEYRRRFESGDISEEGIDRALFLNGIASNDWALWKSRLLKSQEPIATPLGLAKTGIRASWCETLSVDLNGLVHPLLFRLVSSYLDQGISVWRMPHASDSFWNCIARLVRESFLPLDPLSTKRCRALLNETPEKAALSCLKELVGEESLFERYLLEMLLAHPGWSGMIQSLESNPGSLIAPRQITLLEFAAVELLLESAWMRRKAGPTIPPVASLVNPQDFKEEISESDRLLSLWHEAMEWSLYEDVLKQIETHPGDQKSSLSAEVQAFFCIDDRECSFRRHLEDVLPSIQTYSTAGFFGLDFVFEPANSSLRSQRCPVVMKSKHLVREVPRKTMSRPRLKEILSWHFRSESSSSLFRGWLLTQVLGVVSILRLAVNVFKPGFRLLAEKELTRVPAPTELELLRTTEERTPDGLFIGFSIEEMTERVFQVLLSTGLTSGFSRLIVFVAHGSTSANNPYFAAYDCGACSGRPGAPNARAFALMANDPRVREALKKRDLHLPEDCFFLGALHDTAADELEYFDLDKLPETHQGLFERFHCSVLVALRRNAKERCRMFEVVSTSISEEEALKTVQERAVSIFEPRPEYNHATNAFCIVGRRSLTRGLSLNRRAFLNSYDPLQDKDGVILEKTLEAALPVCAGINLEYFFSRVDNNVYGAGSKLPHNIVSLLGVANGVEGDLLTGLPQQMVEIHDPVRLLVLIEQEPEMLKRILSENARIREWVAGEWVRLASFSPSLRKTFLYHAGEFIPSHA